MAKKYIVTLTAEERGMLEGILDRGNSNAQKRKRAHALLLADEGMKDADIAERVRMHRRGIEDLRQRFVEEGFEKTLEGKPKGHPPAKIRGDDEARLVKLVCTPAPDGHEHWSLRYLSEVFATTEGEHVSHETIRQTLKKTN